MREVLEAKLARFEELERQMLDPAIVANPARMAAIAREHGSLAKLVTKYRAFKHMCDEVAELKQMAKSDDQDEREMASAELPGAVERREELWNGNREDLRGAFLSRDSLVVYLLRTERAKRRRREALAAEFAADRLRAAGGLRVVRLRGPREADAWLAHVAVQACARGQ